jgi:predicted RNA binding protein YcfA (HicA-like mRNA interferase family)
MGKLEKLLIKILRGTSDANIDFAELRTLLIRLGFEERIKGSHHILSKDDLEEILNIQSKAGKAKPYQVKQVRTIIVKYKLKVDENDEQT